MERLGTITRVRRYPVKSMAGEDVTRVFVGYGGVVGDRVYALVGLGKKKSFPWLTARQTPRLLLYKPRFMRDIPAGLQYPDAGSYHVMVRCPGGQQMAITDPAFLDLLRNDLGYQFELRFSERGMQDARPLSIMGEGTIDALSREVSVLLDERRFRANLYVRWDHNAPGFFEDTLVDRQLQLGDRLTVLVSKKDPRCKVIGLDPDTAEAMPAVLDVVMRHHAGCAGVYGVVLREGTVEPGTPVYLAGR